MNLKNVRSCFVDVDRMLLYLFQLVELLDPLRQILQYPFTALRHMVSRILGVLSKIITQHTMQFFIERILPLLETSDNLVCRQGAVEAISRIISS